MKTRDIVIIAGVGIAAYFLLQQKKKPRYTITVPEPDRLTEEEDRRLRAEADRRRIEQLQDVAEKGLTFIQKLFGKKKEAAPKKVSGPVQPKCDEIGLFY
jgi:hypothetical protein